MKRTIKSPTLQSGARIQSQASESIRNDYTPLVSLCNTKPTNFYIGGIHCDLMFYKNLTSAKVKRIFAGITSFSGTNRTRQQAVFLRPLFGRLFKPIYGGLRKGNTRPSGNTFRRLNAVIETRHPIITGSGFIKTFRRA